MHRHNLSAGQLKALVLQKNSRPRDLLDLRTVKRHRRESLAAWSSVAHQDGSCTNLAVRYCAAPRAIRGSSPSMTGIVAIFAWYSPLDPLAGGGNDPKTPDRYA